MSYCNILVFFVSIGLCYGEGIHAPLPQLDGRIVGGETTTIEEFPYQLSLMSYGYHICGAAIISDYWAASAAHCVYGSSARYLALRAGSSSQHFGGQVYDVSKVHAHENYSPSTLDYDFAVLKVAKPFSFSFSVRPIQLAEHEPNKERMAIVTGWGTLSSGGGMPSQLQKVSVPIVERGTCQNSYYQYHITSRMVCAGYLKGGKDACQGDSGGPLVVDGKLVGIVSWGMGCAQAKYPGIYSSVANQRAWILNKLTN